MRLKGDGRDETILFPGINPFYQTEEEIVTLLKEHLGKEIPARKVEKLFFYGAGCSFPEKKAIVRNALGKIFTKAEIIVENDLLAASRALFQKSRGIACILGTGSNSCLYDGEQIVQNVSPLGFILGDEGSGATIGKRFVADCLKGLMPQPIREAFFKEMETTVQAVMDNVYKKPFPNRYLASLCRFIYGYRETPYVQGLIKGCFSDFFERNILQYHAEKEPIGFVGSIAYYFEKELREVAEKYGFSISLILKQPMEGLDKYHTNNQ
ncbi:MAG: ATPase [Paludibacteraceae bacterium]|nr:ATPase [Paludibacteraceae bacterium]